MADFDERALPPYPVDSIRIGQLSPWMVWTAAGAIMALAVLGLYFGVRGSHPAGITLTLADQLGRRHITLNTVNPGPTDTGYSSGPEQAAVASMFPTGRWGQPDDAARLITWLCTDDASWITGQIINSEGGFARWRAPAGD